MPDEMEPGAGRDGPVCYQIRLRGELDPGWSDWFDGLRVAAEGGGTLLVGRMDQATLHGVLKRVRDLGVPLISVLPWEER
jgi:hypothetical protein